MLSKALVRGAYQRKCEELARLPGMELTVLSPPQWTEAGHATRLERAYTSGYDLIELPIRFDGRFHLHYYPMLGRWLKRLKPDLFHVDEEPYNLATFHGYLIGRRAKRLFFTWQNLDRRYPPPFGWMERYVLARSAAAIAGNEAALAILRRKGFRGPAAVIPQVGFDPELFVPAPARHDRPFTIGYLGRLERQKGLLDLLEAAAGLTGHFALRLVGYGPLEAELHARAAALGLEDRLEILPAVASTEVVPVYHGLDAFALPSRSTASWVEQFGRVLIEAMACGVPVVASDSGELPHAVGDAGLIFPEGDVSALRAHLQRLIDDDALRGELIARGRRRFLERFTQARVARATYDLYQRSLASAND